MPADLFIYAIVAAGLVFWLRSTLGTRQEGDDAQAGIAKARAVLSEIEEGDKKPQAVARKTQDPQDQIDALNSDHKNVMSVETLAAQTGLKDIIQADPAFDLKFFAGAAQDVFVMVVEAFADNDKEALEDMLGPDVYSAFEGAIDLREEQSQKAGAEIQAISDAKIIDATIKDKTALITVRFAAEQISFVEDKDGKLLQGDHEKSSRMIDIWTFSKQIKSKDPRWLVTETRGDFEGDNDLIPNS